MLSANVQVGSDPPVELDLKAERVQRDLAVLAEAPQAESEALLQVQIDFNGSRLVVTVPAPPRGGSSAASLG
jgi:hypothetical protein